MAMISRDSKRPYVEGDQLDRLTALPISVKHHIQERLSSMEEAARMSILSRPWRYVWASIPKLVFSAQVCQRKPLIDVIDTILLQHHGAIKTFVLEISSIPPSKHSVIDQWMLLLSRNGIMNLNLLNLQDAAPYILPSYMYDVELESLCLANCIFKPPCSFRGFHKLKSLSLLKVVLLLDDIAASFLWMPYLVILQVNACSGFPNAKIYAPRLSQVYFLTRRTETLDLGHFMDCRKLKTVRLVSSKKNQEKPANLTYLLNCWTEIRDFTMDNYYLKSFATEAERLPAYLNNLKVMTLFEFDFDDEDQIFSLLRMFILSPNLNDLHLVLSSKKKDVGVEVNVINHFEGPFYRTLGVLNLERLTVKNFHASRIEMLFVKFVLASAPSLLQGTILIEDVESVDQSEYLKITKELMSFPRASPTFKMYMKCDASKLGILTQEGSFHAGM